MAARKTSALPTRIWKFSARVRDEAVVFDILHRANRYYNELVRIERDRVARYREIRRRHAPMLAGLEELWEDTETTILDLTREAKRERQRHYRETGEKARLLPPDIEAQLTALRAEQKRVTKEARPLREEFSALLAPGREEFKRRTTERAAGGGPRIKARVNAEVLAEMLDEPQWGEAWAAIAASDDAAHHRHRAARASCGLPTGTYGAIEAAFERAKQDSSPLPPRFHGSSGEGRLVVQTRDMTWADALVGTMGLSVRPAPHDPAMQGDQSLMRVVRLDQSVPRGERRALEMTVRLHRMPPDDAVIKYAALFVRRVGRRSVFELQLTLEHASFAEPKRPAGTRPAEHLRIGWARVDGGIRVAHWPTGDVVLPDAILRQHEHAASIKAAADRYFDRAKRMLARWTNFGGNRIRFDWVRSERSRAALRRVCRDYARWALGDRRVKALWQSWRQARKARGEDLYAPAAVARRWLRHRGIDDQTAHAAWLLYTWARKDEHLTQYHADSLRRFAARRDAVFRACAIRIATEFAEVTVDKYAISSLRELPSLTMPGDPPMDQAQHNAHAAAPGRFRELLREVMGPRCTPCERSGGATSPGTARKRKGRATPAESAARERPTDTAAE